MATIRSYTTIEQSRKLAEILPLESADMYYCYGMDIHTKKCDYDTVPTIIDTDNQIDICDIPCWSLANLLVALPFHLIVNNQRYAFGMHKGLNKDGETYIIKYNIFNIDICLYSTDYYNNPVDACVAMIEKLHELKML